eukprot:5088807-Prymnesium_polylepis.1
MLGPEASSRVKGVHLASMFGCHIVFPTEIAANAKRVHEAPLLQESFRVGAALRQPDDSVLTPVIAACGGRLQVTTATGARAHCTQCSLRPPKTLECLYLKGGRALEQRVVAITRSMISWAMPLHEAVVQLERLAVEPFNLWLPKNGPETVWMALLPCAGARDGRDILLEQHVLTHVAMCAIRPAARGPQIALHPRLLC